MPGLVEAVDGSNGVFRLGTINDGDFLQVVTIAGNRILQGAPGGGAALTLRDFFHPNGGTWASQAAADQELNNGNGSRLLIDLASFTQFRLTAQVRIAGAAGADIRLRYSLNGGVAWTNLDGATGPELSIGSTGQKNTPWTAIDPVAIVAGDLIMNVWGKDGNGAASPTFTAVMQLR